MTDYESRIVELEAKVLDACLFSERELDRVRRQSEITQLERKAKRAEMWWHLSAGFVIGVSVMQILYITIQALGH